MSANYLSIYLNDHHAGACAGVRLARRLAGSHTDPALGADLTALADEIEQDRDALRAIMDAVNVAVNPVKALIGTVGERIGRAKPNGHLVTRSPLSALVETEILRLGVEGKLCGWRTLRILAETDPRLDRGHLDELIERASAQSERLEAMRSRFVAVIWSAQRG